MELDFDKEMDALLRRSAPRGVLVGDTAKLHMDADAIAAFAENALPDKTRRLCTEHLSECDPCRKTLSHFMVLNADATTEMAAVAAPVVAAASSELPWYRKLFATPNLAYSLGGLILVFGGLLGFVVFRNMESRNTTTVSQVQDTQSARSAPALAEPMAASNSNVSANAANATSNVPGEIPRAVGTAETPTDGDQAAPPPPPPGTTPPTGTGTGFASAPAAKPVTTDGLDTLARQPAPKDLAKSSDEERQAEDKRAANEREVAKQEADSKNIREQQLNQANQMNQMTPGAGNRKDAGPSRAGIQRDNRVYDDSSALRAKKMDAPSAAAPRSEVAPIVRNAGGKKFEQRQGVWYDTAYRGQSTKKVRRGSSEYRDLDGGLRSIAESLGGPVVTVWNGKAYRIQ